MMQISLMRKAEADVFSPPTRQSTLGSKALEEINNMREQ
jgi:hypothetical protein